MGKAKKTEEKKSVLEETQKTEVKKDSVHCAKVLFFKDTENNFGSFKKGEHYVTVDCAKSVVRLNQGKIIECEK